jgi:hypothetical protein
MSQSATTPAVLLVVYIPPPLRAEADRIESMLIIASERVVVAVAMSHAIVVVRANMPPLSTGIRWACQHQGECKNDNREDYCSHRGLDELALRLSRSRSSSTHVPLSTPPQG